MVQRLYQDGLFQLIWVPGCGGRLEYLGGRVSNASAHAVAYPISGYHIIPNTRPGCPPMANITRPPFPYR